MNVRFLPGRWAEHLTAWEAKAKHLRRQPRRPDARGFSGARGGYDRAGAA